MPRSRRRHRSCSHSRPRSHSGSIQYEHKRRHIDYDSPQSKGTYSGERVLTVQSRRYKRSHRRSPSSTRQHAHRGRARDRAPHPSSSRRARIYRHRASSSTSQDRHRHRSPSSRSQVSLMVLTTTLKTTNDTFCPMHLSCLIILYYLDHFFLSIGDF